MAQPKDQPTDTEGEADLAAALPDTTTDPVVKLYEHWQALSTDDPQEVQERILRSIITAQSPADLLRAGEATPASELYGVPVRINAIRASESDFEAGVDWYLHVDAELLGNGDRVTFSCGARDVCIKLVKADMEGWLPITAVMERATKPTRDGFYPVFLRELPPS